LAPKAGCFLLYILIVCLFALLGSGFGLLVSATILDVNKALMISVIIVITSVLLGGFFLNENNMRSWVRWSRWMSFMKYSYELLLINEFRIGGRHFTPTTPTAYPGLNPITGNDVLNHYHVETNIWGDLMFLCGMIVLTRVLAYLALRFLNKPKS
jgi:ABC-type transport system involved in multi-copper enzyme maturation permease subunit